MYRGLTAGQWNELCNLLARASALCDAGDDGLEGDDGGTQWIGHWVRNAEHEAGHALAEAEEAEEADD